MSRITRSTLLSIACAALPLTAAGQTDEPVFADWRANPLTIGSRPAGMGGAFVAVADDARAAFINPAGLTQIPITELSISSGRPWLGIASGRRRLRFAAYYTRAEQEQLPELAGAPRPALQPATWEAGVAAGFQPFRLVRLGIGVAYRSLEIEQEGAGTETHPLVGGSDSEVRVTLGALVDLIPARVVGSSPFKLGVSVQPGVSFRIPRPGQPEVEIRRPTVAAAGLSWRASYLVELQRTGGFHPLPGSPGRAAAQRGDDAGDDFAMPNAWSRGSVPSSRRRSAAAAAP